MSKAIKKLSIGFGMAHIPVELHTATRERDVKFRRWHVESNSAPRQVQLVEGKVTPLSEIGRAFGIDKDHIVIIEEADLAKIEPASSRHMQITDWVPKASVDPLYVEKTYFLHPQEGAERAFTLMCEALQAEGAAAITKMVMKTKEHQVMIHMNRGVLCLSTLFYADEIAAENAVYYKHEELPQEHIDLARQIIRLDMGEAYEADKYEDTHRKEILAMIEAKAAGLPIPEGAAAPTPKVGDIIELLRAQLEERVAV